MNKGSINIRVSLCGAALLSALPLLIMLPGCGGGSGGLVPGATSTPQPTTSATTSGTPTGTITPTGTQTATPNGTTTATPNGTTASTPQTTTTPRATSTPRATTRPTSNPTTRPTTRPTAIATTAPTAIPGLASPIFFDAFLADNLGQPAQDFNGFFQWSVTGGTVDLLGGNVPGATDQTNGRFVDLDGGQSGRFATRVPLPFAAGATYNLRFDYFSTDGKSNAATVTVGSQTFRVTTSAGGLQSFNRDFSFPTATTALLAFQDAGNDGNGIGIDNVVLSQRLGN